MLYHAYEMTHAAVMPMRAVARLGQSVVSSPMNPLSATYLNRTLSASMEMFINATRRYGKPEFELPETVVDGVEMVEVISALVAGDRVVPAADVLGEAGHE